MTGESDRERRATRRLGRRADAALGSSRSCARRSSTARCSCTAPRYGYQPSLACDDLPRAGALPACAGPARLDRTAVPSRAAAGADRSPSPGRARTARATGCVRRSSGRCARPRSGAAASRGRRWRRPAVTTCSTQVDCRRPRDRDRHAGRRAGRPRAATPPRCCSTPGCRSAVPGSARGRGGAASLVRASPAWCAPATTGGRVVAVGEPHRARPAGPGAVGSRAASPSASSPSARRPPHPGGPGRHASPARPSQLTEALAALQLPSLCRDVRSGRASARRVPPGRAAGVPRRAAPGSPRRCSDLQAGRSTRKLPPVRVQVDPTELV